MELIIRAITSIIDNNDINFDINNKNHDKNNNNLDNNNLTKKQIEKIEKKRKEEKRIKEEKNQAILEYLKSLMDRPKNERKANIHNLYLYFLSRSKADHQSLIDYLEAALKMDENSNIYYTKKKMFYFNWIMQKNYLKIIDKLIP